MIQAPKVIILIDDDSTTNFLNKMIIQKSNLVDEVIVFDEAEEALIHFKTEKQEHPFLVLLDINMPIMNGWEFLKEYSQIAEGVNANIVMLTSSIDPSDKQKAEEFDFVVGYQSKPLSTDTIKKLIKKYLS